MGRVKKYSCPLCSQESSRRYNMQVHIERKRNGLADLINNYKPTSCHPDLVDRRSNQKVNPSLTYYAGNIRRYLAIPNSNKHSRTHRYSNDNDPIDSALGFMEKAARFRGNTQQLFP